jgi:hypothetical protein
MIYSTFEQIAFVIFNKEIFQAIKQGSLSGDFLNSKLYLSSVRFLTVIINILEPLPYKDIKELALMVFKAFVFIKVKSVDLDNEINNTWEKYRETFLANFKARIPGIIEIGYLKFDLDKTNLGTGHGSTVPLNLEAFIQMYQTIDPLGFPISYEEFVSAIKKIEEKLQDSTHPEAPEKINSGYTVKSVIIAYFYMYKKGIYPIPEIAEVRKKLQFYKKLADMYKLSYYSFRTDWKTLEEKMKRLAQPESIRLAIKLLRTFDDPKIKEAIELATSELNEAGLKS